MIRSGLGRINASADTGMVVESAVTALEQAGARGERNRLLRKLPAA
jgi:hypothetical protein